MGLPLRAYKDDTDSSFFGPDRQRFTLFLVLAVWLHLGAFYLFGHFGLSAGFAINPLELPKEQYLELALELAGPTEELVAASTPPPEAMVPPDAVPPKDANQEQEELPPPEEAAHSEDDFAALQPSTNLIENSGPGPTPLEDRADNTVNLEDTAPEFKSYHTYVRTVVARHWILPPEARTNFKPGRFTAIMTLSREGQVILIVVEESSGSPGLDYAAMEALRGAAPYPPFPPELQDFTQLNFRLHFDYRAIQRRIGPPDRQTGEAVSD
jgi:TonB family protein